MNLSKILLVSLSMLLFSITGCTSIDTKLSSPNNVVISSHFIHGSISAVENEAKQYCGKYRAIPVLRETKKGGIFSSESGRGEMSLYYFDCIRQPEAIKQVAPPVSLPSVPIKPVEIDLSDAKRKCTDLGFKSGTEGFGKCVLQLSK